MIDSIARRTFKLFRLAFSLAAIFGVDLGLAVVATLAIWLRVKPQLRIVQQLAPMFDEEYRSIQEEMLNMFTDKLDIASTEFCSFLKKIENNTSLGEEWQVKAANMAILDLGKT